MLVAIHPHVHARMYDGAKSLGQHHRQTTVHQIGRALAGDPRIERHQRIDAKHQIGSLLQRHRGMQRLDQRTVHIVTAIDQ